QPRRRSDLQLPGKAREGFPWRLDRVGPVRLRPESVLAQLQVPPAARAPLLLGELSQLHDDGGRRPERPRLRRARTRGRRCPSPERLGLAGTRLPLDHGQDGRAVHAGRLLLPDDDPPAARLAALRALPPQRRGTRPTRPGGPPEPPL